MKVLSVLILFLLVTINTIDAYADNPPSPGVENHGVETDIFLLGQEPKDDKKLADGTYKVEIDGKRTSAKTFTAGIGDIVIVYLSNKDVTSINTAKCLGGCPRMPTKS